MKTFRTILITAALAAGSAIAQPLPTFGIYHEASCPSVDAARMTRMKRGTAIATGLVPAADCHREARVAYLGTTPGWGTSSSEGVREPDVDTRDDGARTVSVRSYTRADGTRVQAHKRRPPRR